MHTTVVRPRRPTLSLRRGFAIVLWVIAAIASTTFGLAGFFGAAIMSDCTWVFSSAGVLLSLTVGYAIARLGFAVWRVRRPRCSAAILAGVLTMTGAGTLGFTAFIPIDYEFVPAAAPKGTQYWELPSGSRIAFLHAPPTAESRGETVVFVHGGPGTPGEGFPPGTDLLTAAGYDVYVYDQVGSGRSTRLDDITQYTVDRQVRDLEAIRELIGAGQLNLVGRSWGASLAAQYIYTHPDRVAAAIFVSPGPLWPGAFTGEVSDPWATLPISSRQNFDDLLSSPRVIVSTLLIGLNPNAAHNFMGDAEADALLHVSAVVGQDAGQCPGGGGRDPHSNAQGFYVNQITSADFDATSDPRPALREIHVPVLIIRGECDFVRAEVAHDYSDVFDNSTFVSIPGSGHAVWGDAPPAYLEALESFLVGVPAKPEWLL